MTKEISCDYPDILNQILNQQKVWYWIYENKNDIMNREISKNIKVWYFTIYDLVYSKRKQEQRVRLTTPDIE